MQFPSPQLPSPDFPSLAEAYQKHLAEHGFNPNPAQEMLVARLQILLESLAELDKPRNGFFNLRRYFGKKRQSVSSVKGIYVWGDVGCGKTFLLNLLFRHLPIEHKTRIHFHEFMREIHTALAQTGNTRDPLAKIAKDMAKRMRLLYLDEFHVTDIGDAMILGELLKQLLENGVVMAMSSNSVPSDLYRDGLQRQRFLPAISLIEKHLEVFELHTGCDYRLQFLSKTKLYNTPADAAAERVMTDNFHQLITDSVENNAQLQINGHNIPARRRAGGVIWFDFAAICGGPRSSTDYLEIAQCYETVLVSEIPFFEEQDDLARRFINMIDTFYDCNVRFIASAAAAPDQLYRRGRLAREFRRTTSRLIEMRSSGYITQAH